MEGDIDTLESLLAEYPNPSELILQGGLSNRTALHYAKNLKITNILVECVNQNILKDLLWKTD